MLLLLLPFLFLCLVDGTANLCSTSGLCCRHRDSGCVVQHVLSNHSVDTTALPCYCDHACLRLEDCCPDFKDFCGVRDCSVSEWGPWSPCPDPEPAHSSAEIAAECARTVVERRRVVLHQPLNGGTHCPGLAQRRQCRPDACPIHGAPAIADRDVVRPTPAIDTGRALADSLHHISKGFLSTKHSKVVPGCVEMVLVRASHGCHTHGEKLKTGTRICIQCPSGGDGGRGSPGHLCHRLTAAGQEVTSRRFRLSAHCHGRLALLADRRGEECACDSEMQFRLVQ